MTNSSPISRLLKEKCFKLTVLFSSVLFLIACFLASDRSVWMDEAMYLSNLNLPWLDYFKTLPLYDQGSPPLVSVLFSVMLHLFSDNVYSLRLAILLVSSLALIYFGYQLFKAYQVPHAVASLMFLLSSGLMVRYFTEIKQYAIEIAVSLVLLGFFVRLIRNEGTQKRIEIYLFLVLSLLLTFFSYGTSLVAMALMFDRVFFAGNRIGARHWKIAFILFMGVYMLLYLFYFRDLVFIKFNNYHQVYEPKMLRDHFSSFVFWKNFASVLSGLYSPRIFLFPCGVISLLVAAVAAGRFTDDSYVPVRSTLILFGALLLLSALGVYPLAHTRQLCFTLPFLAFLFGWAIQQLLDHRRAWSHVFALSMVIALLLSGIQNVCYAYAGKYDFQRTKNLYEFAVKSTYKRILVECFIQPCVEFYARDGRLTDRILLGRLVSATMILPKNIDVSTAYPGVFEGAGGWQAMIPIGSYSKAPHFELYTDWLISKVPDNEPVLLVTNGPDKTMPPTWEPLLNSIKKRGCSSAVEFEDSGVRAVRLDCSDKGSVPGSADGISD